MREIAEVGYRHALPHIRDWLRTHPRQDNRSGCVRAWQRGRSS
jgi:hypothetical protein